MCSISTSKAAYVRGDFGTTRREGVRGGRIHLEGKLAPRPAGWSDGRVEQGSRPTRTFKRIRLVGTGEEAPDVREQQVTPEKGLDVVQSRQDLATAGRRHGGGALGLGHEGLLAANEVQRG